MKSVSILHQIQGNTTYKWDETCNCIMDVILYIEYF